MKLLIIPDVHGRDFWMEPCSHVDEFDKIVFLGDYHDPYTFQVSQETSRHRLRDNLLPFILENREKCVCLFGNHDGNYLVGAMADRFDRQHAKEIKGYLEKMNLQLVYKVDNYLFSHSGVLPGWLSEYDLTLESLNTLPFNDPSLMAVSEYRGGYGVGSCVWGDVREYANAYQFKDIYQIFGHTQLEREYITDTFACLDCRKAFTLTNNELKPYEKEIH